MEQTKSNYSIIADYYSEHYNELKLYVMSRSLPADEAEDIVQNTFVRLLRGDKMITPVTLPCFVYTIAKNLIIDYYRRKHKIEECEHFLGVSDWMGRYDIDANRFSLPGRSTRFWSVALPGSRKREARFTA